MKPIYAATPSSTPLRFTDGSSAVAIRPADKGEKFSWILLNNGKITKLKELRINGVGVERFIVDAGYAKAPAADANYCKLANHIAMQDGIKLVEESMQAAAKGLQEKLGGQVATFIPFTQEKPIQKALIRQANGFSTTILSFGKGISTAAVQVEMNAPEGFRAYDLGLDEGWIIGADIEPATMPRVSDYGGLVELAAFVLVNAGVCSIISNNMAMDEDAAINDPFPRGTITLAVKGSTDAILVGIDACDELGVQYLRDGQVLCSQEGGLPDVTLGAAVGTIAAVLVKAKQLDEEAQKPSRRSKKTA